MKFLPSVFYSSEVIFAFVAELTQQLQINKFIIVNNFGFSFYITTFDCNLRYLFKEHNYSVQLQLENMAMFLLFLYCCYSMA